MGFKDYFRPKWKHSDPVVRIAAIKKKHYDQELILVIARRDPDWQVRLEAVNQMSLRSQEAMEKATGMFSRIQKELVSIAENDIDWRVCIAAVNSIIYDEDILRIVERSGDIRVRNEAVKHLRQSVQRAVLATIDTVKEVNDQEFLASIAEYTLDSTVCIAAVEKMTDQSLIAKIKSKRYPVECSTTKERRIQELQQKELHDCRLSAWLAAKPPEDKTAKQVDNWMRTHRGLEVFIEFCAVYEGHTYDDSKYWRVAPPVSLNPLIWELPVHNTFSEYTSLSKERLILSVSEDASPVCSDVEFLSSQMLVYKVGYSSYYVEGMGREDGWTVWHPTKDCQYVELWQTYKFTCFGPPVKENRNENRDRREKASIGKQRQARKKKRKQG